MCFRCGGACTDPTPEKVWAFPQSWSVEQIEQWHTDRAQRAHDRAVAKQAKRDRARVEFVAAHPEIAVLDAALREGSDHVTPLAADLFWRAVDRKPLSERQWAVLVRSSSQIVARVERAAARAAEAAAALPVPSGRLSIEGVVIARKWVDSDWGSTCKLMIKHDDGWRVWVTEPSSVQCEIGDRCSMTVTITPSDDDHSFGFGSRPSKAQIVASAVPVDA